jgi:hypothetical protein
MPNFGVLLILALQKKIPIFLIEYIYKDFLEADFIYQKFINILECEKSQKLNIQPLFNFIKIIQQLFPIYVKIMIFLIFIIETTILI